MFVTISSRCYFTLTWMAVRFVRRVHSSDYIDHLLIEKSWKGELAYADHYWPYCSDFTVCDFLQSWLRAWKAWFQDTKITAHRPEKTWAVIFNNQIISGEPSSVAPFLFIILASLHFYVNFLYKISFALWHATECPLEISWSFGTPFLQASVAYGQRVTKRQPSGIFIGLGSSPLSWILLCSLAFNGSTIGIAESSAFVYGCIGLV